MGQFLTAVFEMKPTRRKAAAIERTRLLAEGVFWTVMRYAQPETEAAVTMDASKDRKKHLARLGARAFDVAMAVDLCEPVAQGIARDVEAAAASYVGLKRANLRTVNWPQPDRGREIDDLDDRLDALAATIDRDSEDLARDALNERPRLPRARPLTLVRSRDCQIIRDDQGRLAVALYLIRASDPRARKATIRAGSIADTGEVTKAVESKTKIVVPLAGSLWHENKFLNGRARLASAKVYPRDGRWWLQAQFDMPVPEIQPTGRVIGIDRGVVNPISMAVVDAAGGLLTEPVRRGEEIGRTIVARQAMMSRRQRGGSERFMRRLGRGATATETAGRTQARTRMGRRLDHGLHVLANEVVDLARQHGARVAIEWLSGLKRSTVAPRPKGARKGGWPTILKRAQLGKLERILAYKLALAGLPPFREVAAGGTSQTCPACGHKDPKNRPEQAVFRCTGCGHEQHADEAAPIIIARRGLMVIRKGDSLDDLHRNMVAGLKARDDAGLGPLASRQRVVAAQASAVEADDPDKGLTSSVGQDVGSPVTENPGNGVRASEARRGHPSPTTATKGRRRGLTHLQQLVLFGPDR